MKAVYSPLNKKILVVIYVVKKTGDEYLGRLIFDPEDWKIFKEDNGSWPFVAK